MKLQAFVTVARDLVLLGIGTFGILHQEITGHVNLDLLVLYGVMVGVPGAAALVQVARGSATLTVTTKPSSELAEPSSSPSASSSSSPPTASSNGPVVGA